MENECLKWSKAEASWGWQSDELWKEEVEVEIKNDDETKRKPMITHMIHSDHLITVEKLKLCVRYKKNSRI